VLAVHALDSVFGRLHQQIRVKRGSLFSLDDAKNNDLISLLAFREPDAIGVPATQEFAFKQITSGPARAPWRLSISGRNRRIERVSSIFA